ncbi:unnamed protein product [Lupinus luteus]|uniref:Epidermal patterning factor-like protein n=1 Tax=Lupinus luteus TaxID=3873 RepID=A0AAV1WC07_LUPLU
MASRNYSYNYSTTTTFLIIVLLLLHLMCTVSQRDLLFEEKNRLGSSPPRCHNKCNDCNPCMAVQVPSLPSHEQQLQQDLTKKDTMEEALFDPSTQVNNNRYSNYKPLGWKCHCGNHFFDP